MEEDVGRVYVFRFDGNGWPMEQRLHPSDGLAGGEFGHSVAVSGDVIIVGSPASDLDLALAGRAFVYRYTGGQWREEQLLLPSDGQPYDCFGWSVAVVGDLAVVGAIWGLGAGGYRHGAAYVYRYDGSRWQEDAKLFGSAEDWYGASVFVFSTRERLLIGAPDDPIYGSNHGSACVYVHEGGSWNLERRLFPVDGEVKDQFGFSVAAKGDVAFVGAPRHDEVDRDSGAVYVYRKEEGSHRWLYDQHFGPSDASAYDHFGETLSVRQDSLPGCLLLVGAPRRRDPEPKAGAAFIFREQNGVVLEEAKLRANETDGFDFLGNSVSLSGLAGGLVRLELGPHPETLPSAAAPPLTRRTTRRSSAPAMPTAPSFIVACVWLALAIYGPGCPLSSAADSSEELWPRVERYDIDLHLEAAPYLVAVVEMELSNVSDTAIAFLLNRDLEVASATLQDGTVVRFEPASRSPSGYFNEARVWRLELPRPPEDGRCSLRVIYRGRGSQGRDGRDWRGVLLLAPDELRMSEQTVFYPLVPLAFGLSPAVQRAPAHIRVTVPREFQVFVPAHDIGPPVLQGSACAWSFASDEPSIYSVLAGVRTRSEKTVAGIRVCTLLTEKSAHLARDLLAELAAAVTFYSQMFGTQRASVIGICEMNCRGKGSYNWASEGTIVFDWRAFSSSVPRKTVAHEAAHLWWGQAVAARNPGERFLTESLAEYSAWRYIEHVEGSDAAREAAAEARRRYQREIEKGGTDFALRAVTFGTPGYDVLAYRKGPLVLRFLESLLGRDRLDASLREYRERFGGGEPTIDDFADLLAQTGGMDVRPWLTRNGHTSVMLDSSTYDRGAQRLCGKLHVESGGLPLHRLEALVVIREKRIPFTIELKEGRGAFEIPLETEPDFVQFDPNVVIAGWVPEDLWLGGCRMIAADPEQGAENVLFERDAVVLQFDRALLPLSPDDLKKIEKASRSLAATESSSRLALWSATLEDEGHAVRFHTAALYPNTAYVLSAGGILRDIHGVPVREATIRFRTAPSADTIPPSVISAEPPLGAVDVALDTRVWRVTFSEPMRSSRGFSKELISTMGREKGWVFPEIANGSWQDGFRVLAFELRGPLKAGKTYCLPFRGTHHRDIAGNPLQDVDVLFTTREE
ncbi:MAG: Ig-like domain-containing protein [Planctomycetota bacterium]